MEFTGADLFPYAVEAFRSHLEELWRARERRVFTTRYKDHTKGKARKQRTGQKTGDSEGEVFSDLYLLRELCACFPAKRDPLCR